MPETKTTLHFVKIFVSTNGSLNLGLTISLVFSSPLCLRTLIRQHKELRKSGAEGGAGEDGGVRRGGEGSEERRDGGERRGGEGGVSITRTPPSLL